MKSFTFDDIVEEYFLILLTSLTFAAISGPALFLGTMNGITSALHNALVLVVGCSLVEVLFLEDMTYDAGAELSKTHFKAKPDPTL